MTISTWYDEDQDVTIRIDMTQYVATVMARNADGTISPLYIYWTPEGLRSTTLADQLPQDIRNAVESRAPRMA